MIQEVQPKDYQLMQFVTRREEQLLLGLCKDINQRFRILFLADTGARVSEPVNMKVGWMNAPERKVTLPILKKGDKKLFRTIDMSDRLFEAYVEYWRDLPAKKDDSWLFPSPTDTTEHLVRTSVNRLLLKQAKRAGIQKQITPHMFRHAFGTRLAAQGTPMHVIQYLLGHDSITSTQIYTHVTPELLQDAINSIDDEPKWNKLKRWLFPQRRKIAALPIKEGMVKFIVGRKSELAQLLDLSEKKRNVLITGVPGIGKSVLLDNFTYDKVLRMQDLKGGNKKVIGNILLWLYDGDKEEILKMIYPEDDYQFDKVVNRESEKELMKLVEKITKPKEYTLVIDTLDGLNKTTAFLIEKMKQHFHIIAAAREVKVDYLHTFSNFTKIELKNLNRQETAYMVEKIVAPFEKQIEDLELLIATVFRQTNGNPQYVIELIETFKSEGDFTKETLNNIRHTASQKPIDMTLFFVVMLGCVMVVRYLGGEIGDDKGAFKFIGGASMIFVLFSRLFMNLGKRKYV